MCYSFFLAFYIRYLSLTNSDSITLCLESYMRVLKRKKKLTQSNLPFCVFLTFNIIFGSTIKYLFQEFASLMQGEFEMSLMGELTYFVGFLIKQVEEGTFISQTKYYMELLVKLNMQNLWSVLTSMASNVLIKKDENGVEIDITKYRGIIGSLLYLTTSVPNIMFCVCICARYQALLSESHFMILKRILRYLNKTS